MEIFLFTYNITYWLNGRDDSHTHTTTPDINLNDSDTLLLVNNMCYYYLRRV